ncbi:hypothetical protein HPB47_008619 [Ixodes persulcatus]|uniref:Uncharacterized protein n=1 Tax=Ixodes persulcatus TaxID=34615 RepID=A0AC60P460_IXOPE|nr:hypothetical protein HPB47_008619 [Ixodes persulcatus]
MGKYRRAYAAGFKLQVVKYAEEHGKRAARRKFDVDEKCVRCWCIQQKDIAETNRTRKAFRGKQCKFPKLEEELVEYVRTTRRDGYAVSTEMIREFHRFVNALRRDHVYDLFKVTGISNAMDGTEDDQLWERADEMSSSGDDDSESDDDVYADKHHQSFAPINIIHHVVMRSSFLECSS